MEQVWPGMILEFPDPRFIYFLLSQSQLSKSCSLQLGLGDSIDRNMPSLVPMDGFLAQNVACGWWHTLLLGETQL